MNPRSPLFTRVFMLVWIAGFLQEVAWALLIHFPGFLSDLGATESRIGALYAGSAAVALIARPFLGKVMDVSGRRRVLLVAGLVNATVLVLLTSISAVGVPLLVLFMVQRTMQIALFTAMLAYNADILAPDRRTQGLALLGLAGLIPIMTGGLIGDLLLAVGGFDLLFLAAAGMTLLSWTTYWVLPTLRATGDPARPRRGFWSALAQRDLLPMWWVALLFAVALETLFTFMRTFVDARGVGTVGLFFSVYGAAAIAVRVGFSPRLDRVSQRPVLIVAVGAMAVAYGFLAAATSLPLLIASAALMGFGHGLSFPIMLALVVARAREAERGSATAIFTAIFDVALLLAAPAVGVLIDTRSYTLGFGVVAIFIAGGTAVYAVWDRLLTRRASLDRATEPGPRLADHTAPAERS